MYSMFMLENKCWMKHRWVVAWTYLQSMKTHWIRPYRDNFIVRHKQIQSLNSPSKSSSRHIDERQYLAIPLYFPSTVFLAASLSILWKKAFTSSICTWIATMSIHQNTLNINYLTTVTVSWKADTCSNYKKCVHCSGTGKTTKNIMHASVISDVYFLRP